MLLPYKKTPYHITAQRTSYPWNEGLPSYWAGFVGVPETWRERVGEALVPRFVFPGGPWTGSDDWTLEWLLNLTPHYAYGPFITSGGPPEMFDPPEGMRWASSAAGYERHWFLSGYNIAYLAELPYGQIRYGFAGDYSIIEMRIAFVASCSVIPLLPIFPLMALAVFTTGSIVPPGRRRKVYR